MLDGDDEGGYDAEGDAHPRRRRDRGSADLRTSASAPDQAGHQHQQQDVRGSAAAAGAAAKGRGRRRRARAARRRRRRRPVALRAWGSGRGPGGRPPTRPGGAGGGTPARRPSWNPPPSLRWTTASGTRTTANLGRAFDDATGVQLLPGGGGGAQFIPEEQGFSRWGRRRVRPRPTTRRRASRRPGNLSACFRLRVHRAQVARVLRQDPAQAAGAGDAGAHPDLRWRRRWPSAAYPHGAPGGGRPAAAATAGCGAQAACVRGRWRDGRYGRHGRDGRPSRRPRGAGGGAPAPPGPPPPTNPWAAEGPRCRPTDGRRVFGERGGDGLGRRDA